MNIREIKKEDNPKLKQIIQDTLESYDLAIPGTAYFDPQLDYLHKYYEGLLNAKYWVMEVNGEVVGGVGIAPFNESEFRKYKGKDLVKNCWRPLYLSLQNIIKNVIWKPTIN